MARRRLRGRDPGHREPAQRAGRAGGTGRPGGAPAGGDRSRPRRGDGGGARLGRRRRGGRRPPVRLRDGRGRPRPGRPRRRGGADPDLGNDRPVEARHPDPPGLRDGGRGFPVVDGASARRPADDVAAALPHQRPGLLDAGLGRRPGEPGAPARLLGERVHRLRTAARGDRVQRDRGDARDPDAPTRAARRRGQSPAAVLHRPGAPGAAPARDRGPLRPSHRVRLCHVGDAVRHHLGARHPPLRDARQHPPAPDARGRQRGPRDARRPACGHRRGRRARAAKSRRDEGLLGHARGDRQRALGRGLAAHRRSGERPTRAAPTPSSAGSRR